MGETGSAFLGFALAFLAMPLFSADAQAPLASVLPAFLFPLCEAACSFLRRAAKGKSPFAPDKSHMHHVMFARGFSVPMVCAVAFTFSLLCALCSLLYGSQRAAALLLFSLLGVLGTLLILLFAGELAELIDNPDAKLAIMAVSPSLFFVCVASARRGYFQGKQKVFAMTKPYHT